MFNNKTVKNVKMDKFNNQQSAEEKLKWTEMEKAADISGPFFPRLNFEPCHDDRNRNCQVCAINTAVGIAQI